MPPKSAAMPTLLPFLSFFYIVVLLSTLFVMIVVTFWIVQRTPVMLHQLVL